MAKKNKFHFYNYCLMGKRDGKMMILGYNRDLDLLKAKFRYQGWKDSELHVEKLLDEAPKNHTG